MHTGEQGRSTANRRGGLRAFVAATMATLVLSACSSGGEGSSASARRETPSTATEAAPSTAQAMGTKATTVCIKRPATNPAYDTATKAAWTAWYHDDAPAAEALVDTIADPRVRDEAERAVDLAEAEQAVWAAFHSDDFVTATSVARLIENSSIESTAQDALQLAQQENFLWRQDPRNVQAWSRAHQDTRQAWSGLYTQARGAWSDLYRQSSEYCHPA